MKPYFFKKGFGLVETLIGVSLALIVFLGVFGAYQLGLKAIIQSRNKIVATAIANGEIEKMRNLPYDSVGVVGSFPSGILLASSTKQQNNNNYTIERRVDYVIDASDGLVPPADECPNDYKRAEIRVSWSGRFSGEVILTTDVASLSLAQECSETGGILQVSVFNAVGLMVPSSLIEVKNPVTLQTLKTATPVSGEHYFSLNPATYKVVVSKTGYSTERTYGIDETATPQNPDPLVIEGQLTPLSLSIDKVSSFSVKTQSSWGSDSFKDSFLNQNKISQISNLSVADGKAILTKIGEEYQGSGYLISETIIPTNMISWVDFSFSDSEPEGTKIVYKVLYLSGEEWLAVPNRDLPGNEDGFEVSPINLKSLSTTDYPQLRIRADFSTQELTLSPVLFDWQVSWKTSEATSIPGAEFHLVGEKIIGRTALEEKIFKYSQSHTSNDNGELIISNLEWDNYNFSVAPAARLDLIATDPEPQPIGLAPETNLPVKLYLKAQTSLLLTIEDSLTLEPVFAAQAKLSNGQLGYEKTLSSNEKGQIYFIPLEPATYNLEIQAPGYSILTTQAFVSGDTAKIVIIEQVE